MHHAHVHLLPSRAEAFGIAACEAAHFGRPCIVSSAGGLPSIVRHERTGLILPNGATGAAYADAVERLAGDRQRYAAMCRAARERATSVLNWDRWAEDVSELLHQANRSRPLTIRLTLRTTVDADDASGRPRQSALSA